MVLDVYLFCLIYELLKHTQIRIITFVTFIYGDKLWNLNMACMFDTYI